MDEPRPGNSTITVTACTSSTDAAIPDVAEFACC